MDSSLSTNSFEVRRLFETSDAKAWSSYGCSWSFAQLRSLVEQFKVQVSLPFGATAVVTAEPSVNFVVRFVAMLELGYTQAVLPAEMSVAERFEYAQLLGRCFQIEDDHSIVWLNNSAPRKVHDEAVLVLFTSGSFGQPKGVQLSWRNIDAASSSIIKSLDFQNVSHQWLQLNLHYSFGLLGQLLPALRSGVHTQWLDHMLALVQQLSGAESGGMVAGVPSQLLTLCQILAHKEPAASRVTHVVSAGAHVTESLRQTLHATFPEATIYLNYGQTEASPRILCLSNNDTKYFSSATGYTVGNMRVRLDESGELLAAGDQIMLGYLGDDSSPIVDGWLHTGDLAEINEQGLVTINGRKDSVVKIGGEKVALVEIETAINGLNEVMSAAVTAVDDSRCGKQLHAVMVFDSEKLSHTQLVAQLQGRLSAQ